MRPGLVTWTIRRECVAAFENELGMIHAVDQLTRANLGRSWFRRLAVAAQLYDLQCDIFRRNRGADGARKVAWQSVRRFLVPQWPWLIRRLTPEPISSKEVNP